MSDKFIKGLLKKMTLEEKLGQLTQRGGSIYTPELKINEEIHNQIKSGYIGTFLSVCGPENLNEMQRVAVEESRLGIPLFFGHDIIHGYRTIFPVPAGEACSFEPELAKRTAAAAAAEMRANGIHITWAPMVDVSRDQRWGRGLEGAGEDVHVNNVFSKARVEGFRNNGIDKPDSVACCAKHFVAYGAVEGGRDYNGVDMSDIRLYNTYLPPFKAAIEAGVDFVMTGFHEFNGVPCTVNRRLLKDILRDELLFNGVVISDSASLYFVAPHGYAADDEDLCTQAMNNGLDIEMSTQIYHHAMKSALEKGRVTMDSIDEAVLRVLKFKYDLGLFDNPYVDCSAARDALLKPETVELCRDAARRSMVLLENNGILPIKDKNIRIAVIGKIANDKRVSLGSWVAAEADKAAEHAVTVLNGISDEYGCKNVSYAGAYDYIDNNQQQIEMMKNGNYDFVFTDEKLINDALDTAKEADVVIFTAGEPNMMNGEAKSRSDISVPRAQLEILRRLKSLGKRIITLVVAGRPLILREVSELSDAVIFTYSLGSQMGNAVADVISGRYNPGGRLAVTIPRTTGQCGTMYYAHNNTGQPADDNVWFTSKYIDVLNGPQYCFGYGLSYTEFEYENITTDASEYKADGVISVDVAVRNVGDCDGEEVVQVYVRDTVASVVRPVKELKAFKKLMIKKGERAVINFKIPVNDLGFYNSDNRYIVEPGEFIITAAHDSSGGISRAVYVV